MAQATPKKKIPAKTPAKTAAVKTPAKAGKAGKPARPAAPAKAAPKAPAKKAAAAPAPLVAKPKLKLVRDSFTMPRGDHDLISLLKTRSLVLQRATKKSELLRAGLHALAALGDKQLLAALNGLAPLKAGRPKAG